MKPGGPDAERERASGSRKLLYLVGLLAVAVALALSAAGQVFASGITNSGDDLRDGWYPEQASLTPSLVSGGTFGQLWSTAVEGQVYAQPLLDNGTLLVATQNNKVYGLDPTTGALRWPAPLNLGTPWKAADIGCADLTPNIGVTATPVIDPTTNTAYLTHKTYVSGSSGPARWYMDAIEVATGKEKAGFPVELSGAAQNHPSQTFQPTTQLQRPGLLLMNGVVYAAFGSHCDITPWQGWIFGVSTAGEVKARWVDRPEGSGAGIWQSGAGLMSNEPGSLFVSTGNGGSPTSPTPGKTPPESFGESVIHLVVQPDGTLKPVDFFAPFDAIELDKNDVDFASGGVTALNEQFFGTSSIKHLAVAVGKDGYVYLLNLEELGGFKQGSGGGDKVVQRIGPYGGVWSRPGIWPGDGGWVYIPTASGGATAGGSSGFLRVYQYGISGTGQPTLSLQATSSDGFGFTSSAPVITSEGTNSGTALVWIIWTANGTGEGAQLRAYDPVPVEGKPVLRWSAPIGTSSKFAIPGVGAGRLYVGTRDGHVLGFGSPVTPVMTGPATNFPTTTIASSSKETLTLTATTTLTLNKLTSNSSQFTVGTPSVALPAQLSAGQTIEVPLTFTPTQTGLVGGALTAETNKGNVSFAMSGTGQATGAQLSASPSVLSLGGTSVGGELAGSATFRNVGGAPLTINAVKLPAAPFEATGVPAVNSTIAAGAAVTINVTFKPTQTGNYTDQLGLETTGGNATVSLTATAGTPGVLKITNEKNEFGPVAVGSTASKSFTVTNTGGTNITITKSKPPSGGEFAPLTSLSEGTTIEPGASLTETVQFTPTAPGAASSTWFLNGTDTSGLHEVTFTGTGTVPGPGSAWSHNGSATISAGVLQTTPATSHLAGSSFFAQPLESKHLVVEFEQTINSGTGADGQTVTFADASKATPEALGVQGGGLGFSGIPGIAVAFDTYKNEVNPSNNFVGISNGAGTAVDNLHWLFTSSSIPSLRTATRHVKVEVLNGVITVWIEGTQVLTGTVTMPPTVFLGFTGGTGGLNDVHKVANVVVTGESPATEPPPAASLKVASVVSAPTGSTQASTKVAFSGSCPSAFTTAALGNGESATPTLTGATAGQSCTVSETPPTGTGWKTTATVNGTEVTLTSASGQLSVPSFALVAGVNTVQFTNTYTEPPAPASLKVASVVSAPTGSTQASTKVAFSGSCPSAFTTAALGNGESATPTLTGATAGQSCTVSETPPTGTGWKTTATVNGTEVTLTSASGQLSVPSFALVSGVNTVQFTNTYTEPPPPPPASLKVVSVVNAPTGSPQASTKVAFSGSCPSAFTTAGLGNGESATPTLTGATAGQSCTVSETPPTGTGWKTTATVNGTDVTLTSASGQLSLPSFALVSGVNTVQFTNTYTEPVTTTIPDPTAGGWQLNGTAKLTTTELELTAAVSHEAGSAFWPKAVNAQNLTIEYEDFIGGGSGADGLALVVGDTTRGALPTSLGVSGGGLGFSGIPGLAVALDTYKNSVNPSNNFAGVSDGPTTTSSDLLHWLATGNLATPLENTTNHIKVVTTTSTITVSVNGAQVLSTTATLPTSAYVGFSGGTGGLNDRHAVSHLLVSSTTPPAPASLKIASVVNAPTGSTQASTKVAFSGSCPSAFTTAALGNGESATPTLTGATAGQTCTVSETPPTGTGWKTTATVNGTEVALTSASGQLSVPSFALVAGVNTVQFTNTYTEPPPPPAASLKIASVVNAPTGSTQASTKVAFSGSCPSAFTTAALGNGESATLTGATAGQSCTVSETPPTGTGWKTTATVNGAEVTLTSASGQLSVPSFALVAGVNTVQFTNTYTEPPAPASLKVVSVVNAPAGSTQASTKVAFSGSCPSAFTTAALGNGESATPTLTGAAAGQSCTVSETPPTGTGWTTTATVNGTEVALTSASGQLSVPSFALVAGVNTVQFTNTYTEPPPPPAASLKVASVVNAPTGSAQASTKVAFSGSCPSAFTTAALGNGESATPTLTGATAGQSCTVSETPPTGTGWKTTATVNGTEVTLTSASGQLSVPSFALVAGVNTVQFTNTYTEPVTTTIPDPTAGGWQLNGTAKLTTTELELTAAVSHEAGSAFWPKAVNAQNLTIEYEDFIGGGSGADGLALAFGDATRGALPTSLGAEGGGLGFSEEIPGLAVALDTYKNAVNPSNNFVGVSDGAVSETNVGELHWLATANLATPLENATNRIKVKTTTNTITVSVDGTQVLSTAVTIPTSAYLGFTGGTGGLNDRHAISHLVVASP